MSDIKPSPLDFSSLDAFKTSLEGKTSAQIRDGMSHPEHYCYSAVYEYATWNEVLAGVPEHEVIAALAKSALTPADFEAVLDITATDVCVREQASWGDLIAEKADRNPTPGNLTTFTLLIEKLKPDRIEQIADERTQSGQHQKAVHWARAYENELFQNLSPRERLAQARRTYKYRMELDAIDDVKKSTLPRSIEIRNNPVLRP